VDIFKADATLKSKGTLYIDYRDITQFIFDNNIYHIQNIKQLPCIIFDGVSSNIEKSLINANGINNIHDIIKRNLNIQCVILTASINEDSNISFIGDTNIWGIYELSNAVRQVFWNNKKIEDATRKSQGLDFVITSGQNIEYNEVRKTYFVDNNFIHGLDIKLSYFRYENYDYLIQ